MPPAGADPLGVLTQIRDLLAEMLGQLHHEAQEESHKDAERDLEREKERAAELADGTPVPERPEHHKPPEPTQQPAEPARPPEPRPRDEGEKDPVKTASGLLGQTGFGEIGELASRVAGVGESVRELLDGGPNPPEKPEARKEPGLGGGEKDLLPEVSGLLGKLGFGEIGDLLTRVAGIGDSVQELLGGGEKKPVPAAAAPLVPEAQPRPEPAPLADPGIQLVPNPPPTPEQAEPLPELPSPLVPEGRDPRQDALPDIPSPLTPDATPNLPEWLATRDEPPTIPAAPTMLHGGGDERQSQRRETTLGGGAPTMLAPQPGQGTSRQSTEDEDEGDAIGQTVPALAPGPTPATVPPSAQSQMDDQRLAIAVEKLVALLQREAGGPTGDNDDDETEQAENFQAKGFWKPEQAGVGGPVTSGQAESEKTPPLHPSTPQQQGDPLQPQKEGSNITDIIAGMARFLGS